MDIKKYLFTAVAVITLGFGAFAWDSPRYGISGLEVKVEHGLVNLNMQLNPKNFHVKYNQNVEITPVLKSVEGNDSVVFPSVIVAGRNSYYTIQREEAYKDFLLRSGSGKMLNYKQSCEWRNWMERSRLELQEKVAGCCGKLKGDTEEKPVASLDFTPVEFAPSFHYAAAAPEMVKERKIEGKAYVNFPVNRTEIYPDYLNNPVELRKITNSIDSVRMNPDATVKQITLTGFASPEGPYLNNVRLAKGRTEAVMNYVKSQYSFSGSVFKTNSVPEDWEGLRDSVAHSILPDRAEILSFIDNGNVPVERRNDELRAKFPVSYAFLLKHVYPWLRHTNYRIDYDIRSYTDINEIRRVLSERPQNLSLNEFFLAAESYPKGSAEYDKVFETAVLYYPDSEVANLNAANSAMNEGDLKRARVLLNRVSGTPSGKYAMAILDALEGNYDAAQAGFEEAVKNGIPEAPAALEELNNVREKKNGIVYAPVAE
ncbi:MAG: DUF3868 domain-containing protein [Candidatus Amulumruptor caecigallinarius]|nr:DUF3868 domain-containing protein [Candidatus Amulumruptor caecigallinarius]